MTRALIVGPRDDLEATVNTLYGLKLLHIVDHPPGAEDLLVPRLRLLTERLTQLERLSPGVPEDSLPLRQDGFLGPPDLALRVLDSLESFLLLHKWRGRGEPGLFLKVFVAPKSVAALRDGTPS